MLTEDDLQAIRGVYGRGGDGLIDRLLDEHAAQKSVLKDFGVELADEETPDGE